MQHLKLVTLFAGLGMRGVLASSWTNAAPYSCPGTPNDRCSLAQSRGYDWTGLLEGPVDVYGSNSFSGFTYAKLTDQRQGVRSHYITGNLDNSPSMSGGGGISFSINQMHISLSDATEVECYYGMPDGSLCHELYTSSQNGSVINNQQCGGATSVTFAPGSRTPRGCTIDIYSVAFYCSPGWTVTSSMSGTSASSTANGTSMRSPLTSMSLSSSLSIPLATPSFRPIIASHGPLFSKSQSDTWTQSLSRMSCPSVANGTTPPWWSSLPTTTPPITITAGTISSPSLWPLCNTTSCSSSSTARSIGSFTCSGGSCSIFHSPPSVPYYSAQSSNTKVGVSASSVAGASTYSGPRCPNLLPRCLNTWLSISNCTNNTDAECWCEDNGYVQNVIGCINAWSSLNSESQAASSYLMGICAAHMPENPAIFTAMSSILGHGSPSYNTLGPEAGRLSYTTISIYSAETRPSAESNGLSSTSLFVNQSHTANLATAIAVPKVHFTSVPILTASRVVMSVGLVAVTSSAVPSLNRPGVSKAPSFSCLQSAGMGCNGTKSPSFRASSPLASDTPTVNQSRRLAAAPWLLALGTTLSMFGW